MVAEAEDIAREDGEVWERPMHSQTALGLAPARVEVPSLGSGDLCWCAIDRFGCGAAAEARTVGRVSVDPVGASLGVLPLAGNTYKYWRDHSEVGKLFREVRAGIRKDARIPYEDRESVRDQVESARVDPLFLGGIKVYMEEADIDAVPAIRQRLGELLDLSEGTDAEMVVDIVVETIKRSVNRAIRTDRDAAYHESRRSTREITGQLDLAESRLAARIVESDVRRAEADGSINDRLTAIEGALTDDGASVDATGSRFGPERILTDLAAVRADDVVWVREIWETSAPNEVAGLVLAPTSRLLGSDGEVWQAFARLLGFVGERRSALQAFEEALTRGVEDRPRALMRAAGLARIEGEVGRAESLYDEAVALDSTHPAVVLHAADAMRDDPEALLRSLVSFSSSERGDMAVAEVLRAQAALLRDEPDEAIAAATRALELDETHAGAREIRALARLLPNSDEYAGGQQPDLEALNLAVVDLVAGRDALLKQQRFEESAHLAARLVEAHLIRDERGAAIAALQPPQLRDEERHGGAAARLGQLAVMLGRTDIALELLPGDEGAHGDSDATMYRASALARGANRSAATEGVATLHAIVDSDADDDRRRFAAMALLIAASELTDIAWDDAAAALIRDDEPVVLGVLRGDHLRIHGRFDEAEAELLAHSSDPSAMYSLVVLGLESGDPGTALQRVDMLRAMVSDGRNDLLRTRVLVEFGRVEDATAELVAIGKNNNYADGLRTEAFERAADLAQARRDYAAMEAVGRAWSEELPHSSNPSWLRLLALARLSRHAEALVILREAGLAVVTLDQAILAAEIFYRAAMVEDAVRQIAGLSQQFDRREERLEFLVLLAAMRRQDLPEELAQRVREGFETFPQKFPDSQLMWVVKAPTTAEDFAEFAEQYLTPGAELASEISEQVRVGRAPLAGLAAAVGRSVAETWALAGALPFGFSNPALDDLERDDAGAAFGRGAVWDSSALVTVATLGGELAGMLRNALPTSHLPHAVLNDVDSPPLIERPGESELRIGYDAEAGAPLLTEITAEDVDRYRQVLHDALQLAKGLPSAYDADVDAEDEWSKALNTDDELRGQLAAQVSTFAVATRLGLPVYSDDRWVRVAARHEGLAAFGSVALLDAMAARGMIDDDARSTARRKLLDRGGWGLHPTVDDLIGDVELHGWAVTRGVAIAFNDVGAWADNRLSTWHLAVDLIAKVHAAEPGQLRAWVVQVLDGAARALPIPRFQLTVSLLLTAWDLTSFPHKYPNAYFQAVLRETKNLPLHLRAWPPRRIPLDVIDALMSLTEDRSSDERFVTFLRMARRLGPFDLAEAWVAFVR